MKSDVGASVQILTKGAKTLAKKLMDELGTFCSVWNRPMLAYLLADDRCKRSAGVGKELSVPNPGWPTNACLHFSVLTLVDLVSYKRMSAYLFFSTSMQTRRAHCFHDG